MLRASAVGLALLTTTLATARTSWHVDDDAPGDPGPGDPAISDPAENGSAGHPFDAIQEAIDASANGDTVLVAAGLYAGDGNRDLDYGGRAITVLGVGGYENCIIDAGACEVDAGTEEHRGVVFVTGETDASVLKGLTIRCGFANTDPRGGGILCVGSSPTIVDCRITGNIAGEFPPFGRFGQPRGGGLHSTGGTPTLIGCLIDGNATFGCEVNFAAIGGGVDGDGLTLIDCDVIDNRARGYDDGYGGGISGSGTLTDCRIASNSAAGSCTGRGGGVYGAFALTGCVIEDNSASAGGGCGGGDQGYGGGAHGPGLTLNSCVVRGNSTGGIAGGYGGGVASFTTAVNCLVEGNSTRTWGGGLYSGETVINCTIVGNALCPDPYYCGETGGGVHGVDAVTNCIVWDNVPDSGSATSVSHSLFEGGVPGPGNIDTAPLFLDPDADDYRLGRGSPCIDAADNGVVPGSITTDLAGGPRFIDDPATPDTGAGTAPIVDMGAYEELPCPDGNDDGVVDVNDLNLVILGWGTDDPAADHDGNGVVDVNDLIAVILGWGPCETPGG